MAGAAHAGLIAPINAALAVNKSNDNEVIASAINFLTNVAASERAKEIKVIKHYIEEIKQNKLLANILNNQAKGRNDLTNLIKDLEEFSNNPHGGVDLTNFYSKLTLLINSVRNSIESFEARLNQLLDNYYSKFNDANRMNLSQKINCFKIVKEIGKIRTDNSYQENLNLVAYYLLKGLNEKREEKINEINSIFNINHYYKNDVKKSPIEIIKDSKKSYVKSKLNKLIMNINPKKEKKKRRKR